MAFRDDLFALLFSMSSIRGFYQRFYSGRDRPLSSEDLAGRIVGEFPSIPLLTAREAAIVIHSTFEAGQALSGFLAERQTAAGSLWPVPGQVGTDSPFAGPISGVNPPVVPGLFFPGVSHGTQIYEVNYGIDITTALGTEDTIHLTAMVSAPAGTTYGEFLDSLQAEMEAQANQYDAAIERTDTGAPNPAHIDVIWGATL